MLSLSVLTNMYFIITIRSPQTASVGKFTSHGDATHKQTTQEHIMLTLLTLLTLLTRLTLLTLATLKSLKCKL